MDAAAPQVPVVPAGAARTGAVGVRRALGRWWGGLRWYVRGVLGGSAYDGYLAWHGRHGDGEPLSERAYWRHRTEHQEAHPDGRCC